MALDIPRHRLHNQFLAQTDITEPAEVVRRLGAVQSQDYAGGKWGLGLRMKGGGDALVERAFDEGKILRLHVLRPTWHFVAPDDVRWMLMLSAPRVHTVNGFIYRQQGLDRAVIRKSYRVLEKSLAGGKFLTRPEIGSAFEKAGIANAVGVRLSYIVMSAELDGIVCSGPRRGKQFTYALLEERVPGVNARTREEALVELTERYFATRGPATLHDFVWWSGLTMADARKSAELLRPRLVSEVIEQKTYWFDPSVSPVKEAVPTVHLLPNYDEYFIGFRDRSAIGKEASRAGVNSDDPSFLAHVIILDGQLVGGWRRTVKKDSVQVNFQLITDLTRPQQRALDDAARCYGDFLGLPVERI